VRGKKQKRIFKACGGLFVRCVRRRQREIELFFPALPIGSNEPPLGYPSAMVASLQCPLPFHLVSLFRLPHLADYFFARHRTRVWNECGRVPVPVPPRIHGRAGTAGTIARIGGENDPQGFPTCPTAFRDLRGLCFETLTGCPRSNRKIRILPCPIPRSHGGIPVTGTVSITRFPTILRDASPSNRRV
jgi:hypothetical protein